MEYPRQEVGPEAIVERGGGEGVHDQFTQASDELFAALGHNVDPAQPNNAVIAGEMTYGDRRFVVIAGRNSVVVDQLVEKSKEPDMTAKVPKDAAERFASPESFEKWYAKNRFLVTFWDAATGEVAEAIWLGPSSFQKELDGLKTAAEKAANGEGDFTDQERMLLANEKVGINFVAPANSDDTMAIRAYSGYTQMPRPEGEDMSFPRKSLDVVTGLYVLDQMTKGREMEGQICWIETNLYDIDPRTKKVVTNGAVHLYLKQGYGAIGTYMNPKSGNVGWRIALVKDLSPDQVLPGLDEKIQLADFLVP